MKPDATDLDLLFAAARHGAEPSADDRRRVTARVAQRLALGAGAGAVTVTVSRFGWATSLKAWAVVASLTAGAVSSAYWLGGAKLDEHPELTAPAVAHPPSAASQPPPSVLGVVPPDQAAPMVRVEPEPSLPRAPLRRERATTSVPVQPPTAPSATLEPSSLARETTALRDANATLRAGAPARALALLDDLAKQFPHGMLAEEALATRISALCALGRLSEARTFGARFVQRYPRSPVAARVRSSCAVSHDDSPTRATPP